MANIRMCIHGKNEEMRRVEMNFFECSDEMKTVEKNLLRVSEGTT